MVKKSGNVDITGNFVFFLLLFGLNSFELLDDKDKVSLTVKKNYSFLD